MSFGRLKKIHKILIFMFSMMLWLSMNPAYSRSVLMEGVQWGSGKIFSKDIDKSEIIIEDISAGDKKTFIINKDQYEKVQEGDEIAFTFQVETNQVKWLKVVRARE